LLFFFFKKRKKEKKKRKMDDGGKNAISRLLSEVGGSMGVSLTNEQLGLSLPSWVRSDVNVNVPQPPTRIPSSLFPGGDPGLTLVDAQSRREEEEEQAELEGSVAPVDIEDVISNRSTIQRYIVKGSRKRSKERKRKRRRTTSSFDEDSESKKESVSSFFADSSEEEEEEEEGSMEFAIGGDLFTPDPCRGEDTDESSQCTSQKQSCDESDEDDEEGRGYASDEGTIVHRNRREQHPYDRHASNPGDPRFCFLCTFGNPAADGVVSHKLKCMWQMLQEGYFSVTDTEGLAASVYTYYYEEVYLPSLEEEDDTTGGKCALPKWSPEGVYIHITEHMGDPRIFLGESIKLLKKLTKGLTMFAFEETSDPGRYKPNARVSSEIRQLIKQTLELYKADPKEMFGYCEAFQTDPRMMNRFVHMNRVIIEDTTHIEANRGTFS
jgi:hypothetical protein